MEEKDLIIQAKNGNQKALEELIVMHKGFIVQTSLKYKNICEDTDDLVIEGTLGLLEALKRFDIEKNVKFLTYASFWIKKYILEYISKNCIEKNIPDMPEEKKQFSESREDEIREILDTLSDRERKVIIMRFGLNGDPPVGQKETARILGISRERVRAIECKILNKLKNDK